MTSDKKEIVLTFDTDWAPPFIIEDIISLINDIPVTFLLTDKTVQKVLRNVSNIEIGIHPNFMPDSSHGTSRRQIIEHMLNIVPEAQIVRAHNLVQDSTILNLYVEYGLLYDLSLLEYKNLYIKPFRYWNGLIRIPYNFEDDIVCVLNEKILSIKWIEKAPILICDFHPIHVFLNSENMERYKTLRNQYDLNRIKPKVIEQFVNRESIGIRDLFIGLLKQINSGIIHPCSVSDLMMTFSENFGILGK